MSVKNGFCLTGGGVNPPDKMFFFPAKYKQARNPGTLQKRIANSGGRTDETDRIDRIDWIDGTDGIDEMYVCMYICR